MKITLAVTLLCAFGVLRVSAASINLSSLIASLGNLLSGPENTASQTLYQVNCTVSQLDDIVNDIKTKAENSTRNSIAVLMKNEVNTVAKILNLDPSDLLDCAGVSSDTSTLADDAVQSLAACAESATSDVRSNLDSVVTEGTTIIGNINNVTSIATSSCLTETDTSVSSCLEALVSDISKAVGDLSSRALNATVSTATVSVSDLAQKCAAKAVASVLGNSCSILTDLSSCVANII